MHISPLLTTGLSVHRHVVASVEPICTAADRAASAARVLAAIAARKRASLSERPS